MTEPSERQVLYGLVAAAWMTVVAILAAVAASVGLSPSWWSITFTLIWIAAVAAGARHWRRTGRLLAISVAVFVVWTVGTLLTR